MQTNRENFDPLENPLPPKKRRFQYEQTENTFTFREHTQRSLGISLLIVFSFAYLLPTLFVPFFLPGLSLISIFPFLAFLFLSLFCLLLVCSRMEYTLDSKGLTKGSGILFLKFVKRVPLHEIQSFDYHVYPKGLRSVDAKTDCEVLSVYSSNNVSVSEEECRWLAETMQALLLDLKRQVVNNPYDDVPSPSKTRWKIRRAFDRLEIVRKPPDLRRILCFLAFVTPMSCLGVLVFWLVLFGFLPNNTLEDRRLTWSNGLVLVVPGTLVCGLLICCLFSAWKDALTWIRWTFTENEIARRSFLSEKRVEIRPPCDIEIRDSTSRKPLYRRLFWNTTNEPNYPNDKTSDDLELVIYDRATGQSIVLGDMTFAEARWLRDVLAKEKLVRR